MTRVPLFRVKDFSFTPFFIFRHPRRPRGGQSCREKGRDDVFRYGRESRIFFLFFLFSFNESFQHDSTREHFKYAHPAG